MAAALNEPARGRACFALRVAVVDDYWRPSRGISIPRTLSLHCWARLLCMRCWSRSQTTLTLISSGNGSRFSYVTYQVSEPAPRSLEALLSRVRHSHRAAEAPRAER